MNAKKKNYNFEREHNSNGTPLQLIASDKKSTKNQPPKKKQLQNNKPHLHGFVTNFLTSPSQKEKW